jgi:excinuclease ABC subunit A
MKVLQALVDQGNTVALIEHNMAVIKEADFIVDLGPEGGDSGGRVTATGSPLEILSLAGKLPTATCLKAYLT